MFHTSKQKKKDKLWSAFQTRLQQCNQDIDVKLNVQPPRRHPQRQLHPQQQQQQLVTSSMADNWVSYGHMRCPGKCCYSMNSILENNRRNNINNNSSSQQQLIDPTNVCSTNYFGEVVDDASSYPIEMETGSEEMSIEQDYEISTGGCCSESCGDNSTDCNEGDDYDRQYSSWLEERKTIPQQLTNWQQSQNQSFQPMSTTNNNRSTVMAAGNVLRNCCGAYANSVSNESSVGKCHHLQNPNQNYSLKNNNNNSTKNNAISTTPAHSTVTSTISATAVSVFRYCCRGGISQSNESSIGTYPISQEDNRNYTLNNNNNPMGNSNNNTSKNNYNYEQKLITSTNYIPGLANAKEQFKMLMKELKDPQLDTLCQVVEKRYGTDANNGGGGGWRRQNNHHRTHQSSDCVLVPRKSFIGEEPDVIACRLWLWPDLKSSMELKRTPMCPNGKEKVYICCNPAHWNRILIPETAPPPYQQTEMDRLNSEDRAPREKSKDGGCSTVSTSTSGLRVQIPESFTTNGEDHSSSTWCQIYYWELLERVGKMYDAKNSIVNIYSEGSGGMCLKDMAGNKGTATSSSVQKTRQKIGLGITLSQEADGVWLYNRSEAPIFVHSPTLNDDCRHVSKVPPGYCLNAFDNNRARTQKLVCPPQITGVQTGPRNRFIMQISFAKGWGSKYRRPDVTACHCWLEVHFTQR